MIRARAFDNRLEAPEYQRVRLQCNFLLHTRRFPTLIEAPPNTRAPEEQAFRRTRA